MKMPVPPQGLRFCGVFAPGPPLLSHLLLPGLTTLRAFFHSLNIPVWFLQVIHLLTEAMPSPPLALFITSPWFALFITLSTIYKDLVLYFFIVYLLSPSQFRW